MAGKTGAKIELEDHDKILNLAFRGILKDFFWGL